MPRAQSYPSVRGVICDQPGGKKAGFALWPLNSSFLFRDR